MFALLVGTPAEQSGCFLVEWIGLKFDWSWTEGLKSVGEEAVVWTDKLYSLDLLLNT